MNTCPHCNSESIVKLGFRYTKQGKQQRYKCKSCGKVFTEQTNTIFSRTRKAKATWQKFIECTLLGLSLSQCAELCEIHKLTAFYWRHKLLNTTSKKQENITLSGTIEADETFFPTSYKGKHKHFKLPRKAHTRGKETKLHGISHEKVCVVCAIDRSGKAIAKIACLGRITSQATLEIFKNRIENGATLITDKAAAYKSLAKDCDIWLKQLKDKEENRTGYFNMQRINAFHSSLKNYFMRFRGISSKYLNNYLALFIIAKQAKSIKSACHELLCFLQETKFSETYKQISKKAPMPVLS